MERVAVKERGAGHGGEGSLGWEEWVLERILGLKPLSREGRQREGTGRRRGGRGREREREKH